MTKNEKKQHDRAELAVAGFALSALLAAVALIFCACCTGPSVFDPSDERPDYIETVVAALSNHLDQASASLESPLAQDDVEGGKAPSTETDAIPFNLLQWRYGGVKAANAAPVAGCEIADLCIGGNKMTYKWKEGGCELLGATSRSDYKHTLACLFVLGTDDQWRGGKFDFVSTSRTSRSFANIVNEGYHGWPQDSIETARGFAFVIVSSDGGRRSNVIVSSK